MALEPYTRTTYYPGGNNPYYKGGGGSSGGINPEALSAIQKAIAYYQEGGGFGKGVEAGLERGRTKAMASGMQSLVSAGLGGTTMGAGLGKKYEEEVASPMRARVEEERAQAISGLEMTKAQIIQGATEADRSRALQQYLSELQAGSGGGGGAYRPTAQQPTAQPDAQPYEDAPYSSSVSDGGYSPYAAGGYGLRAGGNISLVQSQEDLYQGGWTG